MLVVRRQHVGDGLDFSLWPTQDERLHRLPSFSALLSWGKSHGDRRGGSTHLKGTKPAWVQASGPLLQKRGPGPIPDRVVITVSREEVLPHIRL